MKSTLTLTTVFLFSFGLHANEASVKLQFLPNSSVIQSNVSFVEYSMPYGDPRFAKNETTYESKIEIIDSEKVVTNTPVTFIAELLKYKEVLEADGTNDADEGEAVKLSDLAERLLRIPLKLKYTSSGGVNFFNKDPELLNDYEEMIFSTLFETPLSMIFSLAGEDLYEGKRMTMSELPENGHLAYIAPSETEFTISKITDEAIYAYISYNGEDEDSDGNMFWFQGECMWNRENALINNIELHFYFEIPEALYYKADFHTSSVVAAEQ